MQRLLLPNLIHRKRVRQIVVRPCKTARLGGAWLRAPALVPAAGVVIPQPGRPDIGLGRGSHEDEQRGREGGGERERVEEENEGEEEEEEEEDSNDDNNFLYMNSSSTLSFLSLDLRDVPPLCGRDKNNNN
ncbi:hypothetical protein E2C01_000370 [Portunus trituberculatus]|uniref:Uncharacterized protein n=1 Tax=Portunus trituberculatus TaxID=210409 RepID=A0A5B7CJK8_PORTR|nr:hypothetical protein [Portunus trituberculatus]